MNEKMSFAEYRALPGVNWSSLKKMATSPLHYKHGMDTPDDKGTVAMRLGRALHTMILERDSFESRHPVFDGKSRNSKAWKEFTAEHPGVDPLTASEAEQVSGMASSIAASSLAMKHLSHGVSEKTLRWDSGLVYRSRPDGEPQPILCKGRCDSVNGHLVELKTCNGRDFAPDRFESHAARLRYHGQIAYYADGLAAQGYEVDNGPAMIVVESEPPFDCAVYVVKAEIIEAGRGLYRKLLGKLRDCLESDTWPGVCCDKELSLGLPAWAEWETLEAAKPITIGGVALGG